MESHTGSSDTDMVSAGEVWTAERRRVVFGKGMGDTENANKRPEQVFSKSAFPLSEEVLRKRKDQAVSRTQTQTQIWKG